MNTDVRRSFCSKGISPPLASGYHRRRLCRVYPSLSLGLPLSRPSCVSASVCLFWATARDTLRYPEPADNRNHRSFTSLLSFLVKCPYFLFYFLPWLSFLLLPPPPPRNGDHAPSTSMHPTFSRRLNCSDEHSIESLRIVTHFRLVRTWTIANPRTRPGTLSLPALVEVFILCRCGGNWKTIQENLDYIQNAGFTAVWISPVNQNYEGPRTAYGDPYHGAYHPPCENCIQCLRPSGYWIQDATQLNSRFGTADDLKALSTELHRREM